MSTFDAFMIFCFGPVSLVALFGYLKARLNG
jgi:hypothetical protein